jgi:hypothetical protein
MTEEFIRFKDIPPNGLSGIHDGDNGLVGHEEGVSCYNCINSKDGIFRVVVPSMCAGAIYDLQNFLHKLENGNIPVYLLRATKIGTGTYGEPVVNNITVLYELTLKEFANPKFKLDKHNIQLVIKI